MLRIAFLLALMIGGSDICLFTPSKTGLWAVHLLFINGWIQDVNLCQELTEKWPVHVAWVRGRRIDVASWALSVELHA